MFINPQDAIREGWVSGLVNPDKQIQPNAIDFTLDTVYHINVHNRFIVSEADKLMRGTSAYNPIELRSDRSNKFWDLDYDTIYDCLSDVYVSVPEGVACMLVTRSTFARNGLFVMSGLYDSGFEGHVGFVLHNRGGEARVFTGTRIGQIIFVRADSAGMYAGGYNHAEGTAAPHQE